MKLTKTQLWQTLLCSALTLALTGAPAAATAILFVPDSNTGTGSIDAAMPLARLNSIQLPRGRALIKGDSITVSIIPEWQFDRIAVLAGKVLDTRIVPTHGNEAVIQGIALFTGGDWLNYVDAPNSVETIDTSDGKTLFARVTGISDGNLQASLPSGQTVTVPLSTVTGLYSPRVFKFSIPISSLAAPNATAPFYSQAQTITLHSTRRPYRLQALKNEVAKQTNDGDLSTGKLVFIGTSLSLLNLAQLAPLLAIPLGNAPGLNATAFRRQLPFLQSLP